MNPASAGSTPAPLHDIAGPLSIFPYPMWLVALAIGAFLAVLGFIVWFTRRRRARRELGPRERALAALAGLRRGAAGADPYQFGIVVSDAIRTYIRDQYALDAVTRTSVEFLEIVRNNEVFSENEKAALAEFLESVDLLKYARQSAAAAEIETLLGIAERLVRGESPQPAMAP